MHVAELNELYSDRILEIAANPPAVPRLPAPDASARKVSRVCGSAIEVDVVVRDGIIAAYGHAVSACALGQTSAAIVGRHIVGTPVEEFLELRAQMHDMLESGGSAPTGRWADLAWLEPVRDFPNRHVSTLLVFDAVAAALAEREAVQGVGAGG